jgi:hypothetical protein
MKKQYVLTEEEYTELKKCERDCANLRHYSSLMCNKLNDSIEFMTFILGIINNEYILKELPCNLTEEQKLYTIKEKVKMFLQDAKNL